MKPHRSTGPGAIRGHGPPLPRLRDRARLRSRGCVRNPRDRSRARTLEHVPRDYGAASAGRMDIQRSEIRPRPNSSHAEKLRITSPYTDPISLQLKEGSDLSDLYSSLGTQSRPLAEIGAIQRRHGSRRRRSDRRPDRAGGPQHRTFTAQQFTDAIFFQRPSERGGSLVRSDRDVLSAQRLPRAPTGARRRAAR